MKLRNWASMGAMALGTAGVGLALKSMLPQHFATEQAYKTAEEPLNRSTWPEIEVTFLRCGHVTLPEFPGSTWRVLIGTSCECIQCCPDSTSYGNISL